ncbi:MAG: S41 family peptidase [Candidatus Brocadiia bacterium]
MKKQLMFALMCLVLISVAFAEDAINPGESMKKLEAYNAATENAIETSEFWATVREIESVGNLSLLVVEDGLKNPSVNIRLACARILYRLDRQPESISVFIGIIKSQGAGKAGLIAAELLGSLVRYNQPETAPRKELVDALRDILESSVNTYQRLALSKLLYQLTGEPKAVANVREILNQKDPNLKLAAALALADMDQFERSKEVLRELSIDPTETGRMASLFLKYKELQDYYQMQESKGSMGNNYQLLDEILGLVKERYVDPNKSKDNKILMEAAAAGLVGSLDRFSSYQNADERRKAQESLNMRYGGIGAYVNVRDEYLTIERPMYGWPAYKAGLRSLDRITEIEGESTRGKDMEYLVNKLKGDPDTQVKIKVFRRGWTKERDFTLTRAIVNVKTARYEMLPGQVGYLLITTFGDKTADEAKSCLDAMTKQGMKSLIIDVRRNGGGYLKAVIEILDRILDKDMILVTTRDRQGNVEEYKSVMPDKIDVPIYVLVDEYSASASEILSGVLQDHKKAVLVGKTTFGKGSVQHLFELKALDPHPVLRMTIALYYLPTGRSIHKTNGVGGLEPDIKVSETERDLSKDYEFNKLLDSGQLDNYLNDNYAASQKLFQALADDDGMDGNRYPKFDELYQNLKTRLEKEEVRQALRQHIRRRVADERGQEFLIDLQDDLILQRAVVEAVTKQSVNPASIPMYAPFANKFDKSKEVQPQEPVKK